MLTTIFGLTGVLIGAVLNFVLTKLAARRQEARQLRTVARLLVNEIEEIETHLKVHKLLRSRPYGLPTVRWEQNEALMADALPTGVWQALSSLYMSAKLFNAEAASDPKNEELVGDEMAYVKMTLDVADDVLDMLYPIATGQTREQTEADGSPSLEAYLKAEEHDYIEWWERQLAA